MENKEGAIQFYKKALKSNCETYEAFDKLISNFLITQTAKEELIKELNFTAENLWLKDFYLSKIRQEVRSLAEQEGVIKRRSHNENMSSHLCLRSDHDESGTTPPRFLTDALYNEDMPLRKAREVASANHNAAA